MTHANLKARLLTNLAAIATGLLVGLSFPPFNMPWLAWVALAPLALVWSQPKAEGPSLVACWLGGAVALAMSVPWMRTCYLDGDGWLGPYTSVWLAISAIGGCFFAGMVWYGRVLGRTGMAMTFAAPLVWVTYEAAGLYGAAVFDQTGFPWGKLGSTQADWLGLAQFADVGGELGLSFLVAMVGGAVADVVRRRPVGPVVAALVLLGVLRYGDWRIAQPVGEPGPVAWLMGSVDMPPLVDPSRFDAPRQRPALLLWPEQSWHHKLVRGGANELSPWPEELVRLAKPDVPTYDSYVRKTVVENARRLDATFVLGCCEYESDPTAVRKFNSLAWIDPASGEVTSYRKRKLVPWAEFAPYGQRGVLGSDEGLSAGDGAGVYPVGGAGRVYRAKPAVCYDLCFASQFWRSGLGARGASSGYDFIVQSGAEGQDRAAVLPELMLRAARLRAIESRRAVVRNATMGYSGLINSSGESRLVCRLDRIGQPTRVGEIPIDDRWSLYSNTGDAPLLLALVAAALFATRRR